MAQVWVDELQPWLLQSESTKQVFPLGQAAHTFPPQSMSVSVPSLTPSEQPLLQTPLAWQNRPFPQAVPGITFAHVPFAPPVNDPTQLWQVPVQAVLQQTPDEQFPERHDEPEVQATPFWMSGAHCPLGEQYCPVWH